MKPRDIAPLLCHYFPADHNILRVKDSIRKYIQGTDEYKAQHKPVSPIGENWNDYKQTIEAPPVDQYKSSVEYKPDGTVTHDKLIEIMEGVEITPDSIITAHGLDPALWDVVSYRNNLWHTQAKLGQRIVMYQSRLTVKPKKPEDQWSILVDDYMQNKQFKNDKPNVIPLQYDASGEVLEVCMPDLHDGLLAWEQETGANYDLNIAKEYFFKAIYDIRDRCKGKKFKRIILATLGDLLHFDNDNQTTTKGTFQQADGRTAKIFDGMLDMLIQAVDILLEIAPIDVYYLSGNHDRVLGYTVVKALEMAFRHNDNITFDTRPNPQKYVLIGNCLIGWCHGDMPKTNITEWLQQAARVEFGQSLFAEVHAGHFHSQNTVEKSGMVVRYLPTISNSSYWEHQQGYSKTLKTMMCFVWNEITGLRDMWFSNV